MCHNEHCMGQFSFTFTFIFMKLSLSHPQEFYTCHNSHRMGQITFTFIFLKLSLSHLQEFYMCHNGHRMGQFTCPGGTLFSSQHETCDWKGKVILIKTMLRVRMVTMMTLNPGGVQ